MTQAETVKCLDLVSTAFNKPLDEKTAALWTMLFKEFDGKLFGQACMIIIRENKFFPTANEVIDAYQGVKIEQERIRLEYLRKNQRIVTAEQAYCPLCYNTGHCFYDRGYYQFAARCICARGRDLNKFSEPQIDQNCRPADHKYYSQVEQNSIRRGKNPFYMQTIREALGDDFIVFEAKQKAKHLGQETQTDDSSNRAAYENMRLSTF